MEAINTDSINIKLSRVIYRNRVPSVYVSEGRENNGFLYYVKGGHEFDFGDRSIVTHKGDFVYIPYNSVYENRLISDDTEYYQVDFLLFDDGKPCALFNDTRIISGTKATDYFMLIKEIYDLYSVRDSSYNISCIGSVCKLINMIMLTHERDELKIKGSNIISKSISYIKEHYNEDTSIEELAAISDISVSNLEKTFKKCYGTTPINYRNTIRINEAKKLILTGLSINDAAERVGWPNYYYFCKIFKKHVGMSPGEFRTVNKGT